MKKLLLGLTLIASMSSFASYDQFKIKACNDSLDQLVEAAKSLKSAENSLKFQRENNFGDHLIMLSERVLQSQTQLVESGKHKARVACSL